MRRLQLTTTALALFAIACVGVTADELPGGAAVDVLTKKEASTNTDEKKPVEQRHQWSHKHEGLLPKKKVDLNVAEQAVDGRPGDEKPRDGEERRRHRHSHSHKHEREVERRDEERGEGERRGERSRRHHHSHSHKQSEHEERRGGEVDKFNDGDREFDEGFEGRGRHHERRRHRSRSRSHSAHKFFAGAACGAAIGAAVAVVVMKRRAKKQQAQQYEQVPVGKEIIQVVV